MSQGEGRREEGRGKRGREEGEEGGAKRERERRLKGEEG